MVDKVANEEAIKKEVGLIVWEAKKLVEKGQKLPRVTITKKVKAPEVAPRFIQYHVTYEGREGTHVAVFPIGMFADDKQAIEHIALTELYRRSRSK